jgi:8-oxo-dGTP pyrophosphatase MutT (NUDIX family)
MVAIKRRDTGEWAIPGGMADPSEIGKAALMREFKEEVGAVSADELEHRSREHDAATVRDSGLDDEVRLHVPDQLLHQYNIARELDDGAAEPAEVVGVLVLDLVRLRVRATVCVWCFCFDVPNNLLFVCIEFCAWLSFKQKTKANTSMMIATAYPSEGTSPTQEYAPTQEYVVPKSIPIAVVEGILIQMNSKNVLSICWKKVKVI